MSPARMVREFHEKFNLVIRDTPTLPAGDERALRARLLREECHEAAQAIGSRHIEDAAQELADVVYVAYGAALHYGVDLDAVIAEVHRSNMTKLWPDGKPRLRADGKVLKPPTFEPPNVAKVIRG